jgi:hypothetical protein
LKGLLGLVMGLPSPLGGERPGSVQSQVVGTWDREEEDAMTSCRTAMRKISGARGHWELKRSVAKQPKGHHLKNRFRHPQVNRFRQL